MIERLGKTTGGKKQQNHFSVEVFWVHSYPAISIVYKQNRPQGCAV